MAYGAGAGIIYEYADAINVFELFSELKPDEGMVYIPEIKSYTSYRSASAILDDYLNGKVNKYDYKFLHGAIASMRKKGSPILSCDVFDGSDPIELKNFYHNAVSNFGWKAAEMIENHSLFGKAYCNAMKYCNKSCKYQDLTSIPDAKLIFEELKKLLNRKQRDGYEIIGVVRQYMQ